MPCASRTSAWTLALFVLASPAGASGSGPVMLQQDWQVFLGPPQPQLIQLATVCSDGTVYFVDALGRLVWVDAQGTIRLDTERSDLVGTRAVACGERNRLYAAVMADAPRLVVLAAPVAVEGLAGEARFDVIRTCELTHGPRAMAVHGDTVFLLVVAPGTNGFLERLTDDCAPAAAFGIAPALASEPLVLRAVSGASLFWSVKQDGLVFMPVFPYEAHVYDRDGTRRRVVARDDPDFLLPGFGSGRPEPGDQVLRAFEFPSGHVVAFVATERGGRSGTYLEWLDEDLRPGARLTPRLESGDVPGVLHGVSGDGALYFGKGTRTDGIVITRARLVPVM